MHCLLTGGGGFIGSRLVQLLLAHGWDVTIVDPQRPSFQHSAATSTRLYHIPDPIANCPSLDEVLDRTDVLVHLAWTTTPGSSMQAPENDVTSNLLESIRLFKKAIEKNVKKIIFASSGGTVYGKALYLPIDEEHPTHPISSYGITKLAVEKYLQCFYYITGIPIVIFRFANAYGPGQPFDRNQGIISTFMAKIIRGEPLSIWGDGTVVRDYVFVDDIAEALRAGIERETTSHVFNIGTGKGFSVLDIVKYLKAITGAHFEVHFGPGRPFDPPANVLDFSRAAQELDWHPRIPLYDGMVKTWQWIQGLLTR
ncbi:NAD-dependent epimerase/dehydratase family protein [Desulfosoma sp.]